MTKFYIPETAEDFELYTSMEGSDEVAKIIHHTLVGCIASMYEQLNNKKVTNKAWHIKKLSDHYFHEIMLPLLDEYSKFGAGDSEPRFHVNYTFERFCKTHISNY